MSDQDKDLEQEIIEKEQTDDAPDTNKDEKDGYEDICYICRRPESKAGKMIKIPNNICICRDCMQKTFDSMSGSGFNLGDFNPANMGFGNMPNISMINLSDLQGMLPKSQQIKKKKPKEKKKGRPKKVNYVYRERSLYFARIQDITKLCELREYDLRGHREIILFLYRYYLCSFTEDVQKALEDVLELNSMFIYPLKEKEVIRATRSAEKCYLDNNKEYRYKNDTLIELLEITEDEEIQMSTIISKTEYKRRNNEYNKKKYKEKLKVEGKLSKKEEVKVRREKIKDLLAEGLSQKEIYNLLKISKRTCVNDVKFLKEQGLI